LNDINEEEEDDLIFSRKKKPKVSRKPSESHIRTVSKKPGQDSKNPKKRKTIDKKVLDKINGKSKRKKRG
jgi:hypothetical protein